MTPEQAIDLGRQALWISLLIGSPVLLAGLVIGLLIGLFQALTQIQEQTIAFVPKIVAMLVALTFSLPWLVTTMMQYTQELIAGIPDRF